MRKFIYAAAGAAALATASIANAAVTVTGATGLNDPNPTSSVVTTGNTTTINFGQNPLSAAGTFTASFMIHNDVAGLYNIVLGTSDPTTFFDSAMFNGVALTDIYNSQNFKLIPAMTLGIGDYMFSLTGHNTVAGGSFTGNVTISAAAVPEATTWAMMLLGFGAMGIAIRRRRRPTLAQLA